MFSFYIIKNKIKLLNIFFFYTLNCSFQKWVHAKGTNIQGSSTYIYEPILIKQNSMNANIEKAQIGYKMKYGLKGH